jgi:hypothetical protein
VPPQNPIDRSIADVSAIDGVLRRHSENVDDYEVDGRRHKTLSSPVPPA